jgi:hypothetical protein
LSLSTSSCKYDAELHRQIERSGFHRDLKTSVAFKGATPDSSCSLVLLDHLSGLVVHMEVLIFKESFYVDRYQLEDLERFHVIPPVRIINEIDLEKPSYVSSPNYVFIFQNWYHILQSIDNLISSQTISDYSTNIPIHIRYQPPSANQRHILNKIEPPKLFVKCQDAYSAVCISNKPETVEVLVPTGQLADERIVTIVTMGVTVFAALIVMYFVMAYGSTKNKQP